MRGRIGRGCALGCALGCAVGWARFCSRGRPAPATGLLEAPGGGGAGLARGQREKLKKLAVDKET